LSGQTLVVSTLVFDEVGGHWLAVGIGSDQCRNVPNEVWESVTLQPNPDGTFAGESTDTLTTGCANTRTVTFTRTGDVNVDTLPDPATLPARVVSPAEALHGRYHETERQPSGFRAESDFAVRTDCLRTGERCMSLFHAPPDSALALVFGGGSWIYDREFSAPCSTGGIAHAKMLVQFPLPQPAQVPITLLTGDGHEELTGSNCHSSDVDVKFERTGD
jgi:serine/threonine-protein kinase